MYEYSPRRIFEFPKLDPAPFFNSRECPYMQLPLPFSNGSIGNKADEIEKWGWVVLRKKMIGKLWVCRGGCEVTFTHIFCAVSLIKTLRIQLLSVFVSNLTQRVLVGSTYLPKRSSLKPSESWQPSLLPLFLRRLGPPSLSNPGTQSCS